MRLFKSEFLDKRLIKFILVIFFAAYFIDFIGAVLIQLTSSEAQEIDWLVLASKYVLTFVIKLLFLLVSLLITIKFLPIDKIGFKSILVHSFLAFVLSFYSAGLGLVFSKYVFKEAYEITWESVWVRGLSGLNYNIFVYATIIAIYYAYHYLKRQEEVSVKQEQLKTQLLDAKINALQSQLQPHFLFNAMNDISSLMDIDIEKSQNALADLSELLRNTLKIKNTKFISLQKELQILQKYLDVEKIRFGEKLHFRTQIDEDILTYKMPPLMLQPFVENGVKHGFSFDHDVVSIFLNIHAENAQLTFEIYNDGKPLEEENDIAFGNGISNVLERLNNLYENSYTFEIKNVEKDKKSWVFTKISIPLEK